MNNRDRVRKALADLHSRHQELADSTLFLDGFLYKDRAGAFKELCKHLRRVTGVDELLDCSPWAPELDGTVMVVMTGRKGSCCSCMMISPAGRVRVARRKDAATAAAAMLHTYAVTKINDKWLKSIERHARVI